MRLQQEKTTTTRTVQARCVPSGEPIEIPAGTAVTITQALGSSFSVVAGGQLVRIDGADADAIGREVPPPPPTLSKGASIEEVNDLVWATLKTCYDPEIPIDIVELGLVYRCDIEPQEDGRYKVDIDMTLTAPGCGMGEVIANEVADKVLALPAISQVDVQMVFDPPWDRYRLSEAARLQLGM
ncbi:MAG TPA: putative Fe-S cluster assembly protein SufT [Rubrivivax sp.]|nr:putative Fe-S cluster assembly protein SufT [Burkholderiales bacterium]HNU10774.1 putative Fe-S cluster assembly protein SufT [Rubrivivax sp.]